MCGAISLRVVARQAQRTLMLAAGALLALILGIGTPSAAHADGGNNQSGVAPQIISLPSGPGSLEGLGPSFEPQLATGTASYALPLEVPPGTGRLAPELNLVYDGGNPNGPFGLGWSLSLPTVERHTDEGLPTYDDAIDRFILGGEKLTPLGDGTYRHENEGAFMRLRRTADGGWDATQPDGRRQLFGATPNAREETASGIFRWRLEQESDTNGNTLSYSYRHDGGYAYLSEIRYSPAADGRQNLVRLVYAPRPDRFVDRRSRAAVTVRLRAAAIEVWSLGTLVRLYRLSYSAEGDAGAHSLLQELRQIGADGVSALPPTTFAYTDFDPQRFAVVAVQDAPPVGLASSDADLVDINADSLPDIVRSDEQGLAFYLNRGAGRWQRDPLRPAQSPPDRLSSPNGRMADMNGDGQVDFLVRAGAVTGGALYYYPGRPGRWWEQADRVTSDQSPAFELSDPNVRLLDINNDKRSDVAVTTGGRLFVWLARDDASWSESADIAVPLPALGAPLSFDNPYVDLADMTGDRIQDLVIVREGLAAYFPHNGNGDFDAPVLLSNPPAGLGERAAAILLGDLNNDGLDDLLLPDNRSLRYWLNRGDGALADPVTLPDTPAYDPQRDAVRLTDVDGDGMTELLFSRYPAPADEVLQYVEFSTGAPPFLLGSIDNGLGRTIEIEYTSSTAGYIADWDAGAPWAHALPFPVNVVSSVQVHDATSGSTYVTEYRYRDGYYDGVEKEYRGFAHVEQIERGDATAPGTRTVSAFDVGRDEESRKGLLVEQAVLAEDGRCAESFVGCYRRQINKLTTQELHVGPAGRVAYSYISRTDNYLHEQQVTPVVLREEFEHDEFGNLVRHANYGQVCGEDLACGDDEIVTVTRYALNRSAWVVDRPATIQRTTLDGSLVSETQLYYDGEAYVGLPSGSLTWGNLSRSLERLEGGEAGRLAPTVRQAFDRYGNVVGRRDANGNQTTIVYDPLTNTFPVQERHELGDGRAVVFSAAYNHGFGAVTATGDPNGNTTLYTYDSFGRLASIVRPGDTPTLPTQRFRYTLGAPYSSISTEYRVRSSAIATTQSVTYFDGLGRRLQSRVEAGDGRSVVRDAVRFDALGRARDTLQPYFDAGLSFAPPALQLATTTTDYDPMGRTVRVTNPGGAYSSTIYTPLTQITHDEEDTHPGSPHINTPRILRYDGLERLVSVEERAGPANPPAQTRYRYDPIGNLVEVADAAGHLTTMGYNMASRRTFLRDPSRGEFRYIYDDNGNLIGQQDAAGRQVSLRYDALNRVVEERWLVNGLNTIHTYHYDERSPLHPDAQNTVGRLSYTTDPAGGAYFSYDARGNLAGRIRSFAEEGLSLVTRLAYDAQDRLAELTYPDGSTVVQRYNPQGLISAIPGFIADLDYNPAGRPIALAMTNGATTSYSYDSRERLVRLATRAGERSVQELSYTYDEVSNLVAIDDGRPRRTVETDQTQRFVYDSLYRLISASGTYGAIDYAYDALGNLTRQSSSAADPRLELGVLRYGEGGAGPYALTSAGGRAYRYDAVGNQVAAGAATLRWDAGDRLIGFSSPELSAEYAYDGEGRRVRQVVRVGGLERHTLYPDQYSEVREGSLFRFVFAGDQRIAEVETTLSTSGLLRGFSDTPQQPADTGAVRWFIADHLGGLSMQLDEGGAVLTEVGYFPSGLTRYERAGEGAPYKFTGKELDPSGLYYFGARYYDPLVSRFISADPLYGDDPARGREQPQTLNLYAYALNNPLRYVDPLGLDTWDTVLDGTQLALDVAGLVPGVGEVADLANAGISLARGDAIGAAASLAAAIPGLGWGATGAKWAVKGAKAADAATTAKRVVAHAGDIKPDVYLGGLFRREVTATASSRGITKADREWAKRIAEKYGTIDGPPTKGPIHVGHVWGSEHVFTLPGQRASVAAQTARGNLADAANVRKAAEARRAWNAANPNGPQLPVRERGSR